MLNDSEFRCVCPSTRLSVGDLVGKAIFRIMQNRSIGRNRDFVALLPLPNCKRLYFYFFCLVFVIIRIISGFNTFVNTLRCIFKHPTLHFCLFTFKHDLKDVWRGNWESHFRFFLPFCIFDGSCSLDSDLQYSQMFVLIRIHTVSVLI